MSRRAVPAGLAATGKTTRTVSLSWQAAAGGDFPVAGFEIYRGTTLATTVTGTSGTVSGLTPNTAYTFTVKARGTRGNLSAASDAVTVTTNDPSGDTRPPTVPGDPRSTGRTSTTVTLAWSASTDDNLVAGYDVYAGTSLATSVTGTTATSPSGASTGASTSSGTSTPRAPPPGSPTSTTRSPTSTRSTSPA